MRRRTSTACPRWRANRFPGARTTTALSARPPPSAESAGYDPGHVPQDFDGMLALARQLFPRGADYARPEYWSCLRPMTPSGAPILGRTRHRNLFLNTGHGHMG